MMRPLSQLSQSLWRAAAAPEPYVPDESAPRLVPPVAADGEELASSARVRLPLYQRAGCVALLDDDPGFVEMLKLTLPATWGVRGFLSPESCLNHLQQEPPRWEADLWAQQEVVARWNSGAPLIPLILQYWATSPGRTGLTKVLVVDYQMAARDGLDVLGDLSDWPGFRILLTGVADQGLAVQAFNGNLIHQFVLKQSRDLAADITAAIQALLRRRMDRYHQIWSSTLGPQHTAILNRPGVWSDLEAFLSANYQEWMIIGEPFGALALDAQRRTFWIQIELESQLDSLAEVATAAGASEADAASVRAGRRLANVEMRQSLGLDGADFPASWRVGADDAGVLVGITQLDLGGAYPSMLLDPHVASHVYRLTALDHV